MPVLKAFLGSSNDLLELRDSAKAVVDQLSAELRDAKSQLRVESFDYRDLPLAASEIQENINPYIAASDCVSLFIGSKLRPGTAGEFEYATKLYASGRIQRFHLYFLKLAGELREDEVEEAARVIEFRRGLTKRNIYYHEVEDQDTLLERFERNLREWLGVEERVATISRRFVHSQLPPVLRLALSPGTLPIDDNIARHRSANDAARIGPELQAYRRYVDGIEPKQRFDLFLIAAHLYRQLLANDEATFSKRQNAGEIHRYLAGLILESPPEVQWRIGETMLAWLRGRTNVAPTTRNFAAFHLGMIRCRRASTDLLEAAKDSTELPEVRYYAVCSLAMLRQRDVVPELADIHADDGDQFPELKALVAQAIVFISIAAGAK